MSELTREQSEHWLQVLRDAEAMRYRALEALGMFAVNKEEE